MGLFNKKKDKSDRPISTSSQRGVPGGYPDSGYQQPASFYAPQPNYAPSPGPPSNYSAVGYGYGDLGYGQQQLFDPPPGPPPNFQQNSPEFYPSYQGPPPPGVIPGGVSGEDPLAALSKYDTSFLIDDSESMEMFWDELSEALQLVIAEAVKYDKDGIDISFFNNLATATSQSADEIFRLFRRVEPRKSTPSATALKRVLDPYMYALENWKIQGQPSGARPKPLNLIVLTDGAPDRGENPESVIVDIARRLDQGRFPPYQVGIQFIQIGVDDEAAEHLRSLDDDLKNKYKIRDMVDTVLYDANKDGEQGLSFQYIRKALLGSMNRSLDRQSVQEV